MWKRGETLGVGASGMISLALVDDQTSFDHDLPSVMAVKSAPLHISGSICREGRILNQLEGCSYVVRCFGSDTTFEKGECWYNLFLEYASGGSLFDRIRESGKGGLPESEATGYTKSVLMGLNYVHKQGYVHCDIKPHNILLVEGESEVLNTPINLNGKRKRVEKEHMAKIADFGVARKAGKRNNDEETNLRGTPMYIAPESVQCGEYEAHSDIWALGCTVLHMITGQVPWKCDKNTEKAALLFRIGFREQVPEIPIDGLSKEARDFLNKCLVRDPKSRWTADMLLAHPFVSGLDGMMMAGNIKDERNRVVQPQKMAKEVLIDSLSSQSWFNLTKTYLLMSHSASNGIVPDFGKIRTIKKMKRTEEEEEGKRFESSFRLDALGRYWGINPSPMIPSSSIAIEIFN
ncbi:hypothetical protein Vadar_022201 [Vaccinium darrowii]|uniref:Uncharacterized protein n=1 Tax=Vaccinium darrowii TaxID=229202 RepID=A0ACB7ZDI2_9ERIC|nr:hypothetical protein Vadar_022201 [Vaccinium darrowii]